MNNKYLRISLIAILITFCLYVIILYGDFGLQDTLFKTAYTIVPDANGGNEIGAREFKENGAKVVLLWNTLFGNRNFYFGEGDIFRDCPVSRCKISNDRSHLNVEDFDAILFHGNELNPHEVPERRSTRQLYVYVNLESPANWKIPHKYLYEDYFNLTMTYRLDSDVPWTYGIVEDRKSGKFVAPLRDANWSTLLEKDETPSAISDVTVGKSKPVAWFVSNCHAKSGRMEYVKELSKHIGVDIYGKCGTFSCDKHTDCFRDVVEPNYFFYLSFENTFCNDYVTEKLINPLRYNVVPVVYGGANYSQFAPPNSYVNALDFESPKELAAYLKYLSQDLRRYQSFLQWKKYYRVEYGTRRAVCTLCEMLHKQEGPTRYSALSDWYAKDKCPIQTLLKNSDRIYATKMLLMSHT